MSKCSSVKKGQNISHSVSGSLNAAKKKEINLLNETRYNNVKSFQCLHCYNTNA